MARTYTTVTRTEIEIINGRLIAVAGVILGALVGYVVAGQHAVGLAIGAAAAGAIIWPWLERLPRRRVGQANYAQEREAATGETIRL